MKTHTPLTFPACVRETVEQPSHQPPTLSWPPIGSAPINEFNNKGYMSCAFPTLGAEDFLSPHLFAVTIGNYLKHLMMYEEGRFARHPRFRYFALNTDMLPCKQDVSMFVSTHMIHSCQLKSSEEWMVVKVRLSLHYTTNLCKTRQY